MLRAFVFTILLVESLTFNLPGLPIDFTADDEVLAILSDDIARHYAEEYMDFVKTGKESAKLSHINEQMSKAHTKKDIFTENIDSLGIADQFVTCTTCKAIVNVVLNTFLDEEGELNGENREDDSKRAMLALCRNFNLQTEEVCSGLFDLNFPYLNYILETSKADARSLCGSLPISFCSVKKEEWNFSLDIDAGKPLLQAPKSEKPVKTANDLRILHLTDIHYDPEYKEGSLADCDEPLCCNRNAKEGTDSSKLAGYWSDYRNCDSPKEMIEDALKKIKETHEKIDFIYHTGDIVPHNVWATTKDANIKIISEIETMITETFKGVKVFSCVGNHEPHPTNVFGPIDLPEDMNVKWLYNHIWSLWSKHLTEDAEETVLKGGYYTDLAEPGLRIVALNNMDCYLFNWWIFQDGSFVIDQLKWLHDVLLEAEKNEEKVHILAHIPSGDSDCWTVWAREYNRIIERFSHVISGIFNGHTHKDEMNVHYSENGYPMMISWNGGSLTAYSNKNPNYRIYEIESKNMEVVDHHTFIFNITEANIHGKDQAPEWFKEYQFSEEFTDDLSPAGIDKLLVEMASEPSLLRKYWEFKISMGDPNIKAGCSNKCLMNTLCRLSMSVYNDKTRCKELQDILKEHLEEETTTTVKPTEKPGDDDDDDDGAASITASLTIIASFLLLLKYVL